MRHQDATSRDATFRDKSSKEVVFALAFGIVLVQRCITRVDLRKYVYKIHAQQEIDHLILTCTT